MSKLNPEQLEAINHRAGPLLALAGAGSGKTRVITERIINLIRTGVDPQSILAVTFTNKAAAEMRARITKLMSKKPKNLVVSTFHSFGVRVLKSEIDKLGYKKNFTIYSSNDCKTLVRTILKELRINTMNFNEGLFLWYIDNWKNSLIKYDEITPKEDIERMAINVYELYQRYLKGYNALDFNDLINLTIELYIQYPDILEKYQDRFRFIMVDEYQDTNAAQYKLISLLASKYKNIVVVGDDDQSIYAFRGADISNILSFEQEYPDTKVITLSRNYRSTKSILDAAYSVIRNNTQRKDKLVIAEGAKGDPLIVTACEDERDEASYVADSILSKVDSSNISYDDFAILFRMNAQSRSFEEALRIRGIQYSVVGTFQFYERKEIKDILAYLNLFVNPDDEVSLLRVINLPKRGIGAESMNRLNTRSIDDGVSLHDILWKANEMTDIPPKAKAGVKDFLEIIDYYTERFHVDKNDIERPNMYELIQHFLDNINYHNELYNSSDTKEQAVKKIENVDSLLNGIMEYEKYNKNSSLKNYLDKILLMSINDRSDDEDKKKGVMLMSIHSAKGLEFPYVYIAGMEEGLLPHHKSIEEKEIEEERRLCYVAMTRAKSGLTITYCTHRTKMGKVIDINPSIFLEEMQSGIDTSYSEMDKDDFFKSMKERFKV